MGQNRTFAPALKTRSRGGRPLASNREVLEGILWILGPGATWKDLPAGYPSLSTCRRRLKRWTKQDIWLQVWRTFPSPLDWNGRRAGLSGRLH